MEIEGKIIGNIGEDVIVRSNKAKPQEKDEMAPWSKISNKFKPENPTQSLFTRYISFYSTLILSGDDNGFISTNTVIEIGKIFKVSKETVEDCLKELLNMTILLKIKRGVYQINPEYTNKKKTREESNALIKSSRSAQNNQINVSGDLNTGPITNINLDKEGTKEFLQAQSNKQQLENL